MPYMYLISYSVPYIFTVIRDYLLYDNVLLTTGKPPSLPGELTVTSSYYYYYYHYYHISDPGFQVRVGKDIRIHHCATVSRRFAY